MGSVAARTQGFTTRRCLAHGGIYASMGIVGLAIFLIGGGRAFFLPIISACWLGLGGWYVIPAVMSYWRERGGRNAASQP